MKIDEPDGSLKQQAGEDEDIAEALEYWTVLHIIENWPPMIRAALIQDISNTLAEQAEGPRPKRNTLERIAGFLKTDQPAPSDEEVEQWLDERRMEKYG
jgi:hypothetical protein